MYRIFYNVFRSIWNIRDNFLKKSKIGNYFYYIPYGLQSIYCCRILFNFRLSDAVNSGLLEIIAPSPGYYPDLKKLRLTLGDSEDRVRWRSKQNLDFAFLMMYCQPKGSFYVQLEDDLVARPQYQTLMKQTVLQRIADGQEWFILDFGGLGFIGKIH